MSFIRIVAAGVLLFPLGAQAGADALYRHPRGFSFRYAPGWSVRDADQALQLVPPKPQAGPQGPTEMYALGAERVDASVERADDPRVVRYVEQQLHALAPALRRTGGVGSVPMTRNPGVIGARGIVLDFGATGAQGQAVWARAYACVVGDVGVVLLGIGLRDTILGRDAALRGLLTSIQMSAPGKAAPAAPGRRAPAAGAPAPARAAPAAGAPAPARAAPAAGAPARGAPAADAPAPAAAGTGGPLGDAASWGFTFRAPAGWNSRQEAQHALLGHTTIAGLIVVRPHTERSLEAVRGSMSRGLTEREVQLTPAGRLTTFGKNMLAGEYVGTLNGQAVRARVIGTASPHGEGGAWIFAVANTNVYSAGLAAAAGALARSLSYPKLEVGGLMRHFAGTWSTFSTNTSSRITLAPNGNYYSNSESSYGGRFTDSGGASTGSWGAGGQNQDAGRWSVRGDQRRGVLTIRLNDGQVRTSNYQVHVEKGQTYWNEYVIDGVHYSRSR